MKKKILSFLLAIIFFNNHAFCQVIFAGDFNNRIIVGNGEPNTWKRYTPTVPVPNDHRWKPDSIHVRQGRYSLRIEVRPGDTSSSTSDRVEIAGMYDSSGKEIRINKESLIQYLAFSVRLDKNWKAPSKAGIDTLEDIYHGIIVQLKKRDNPNLSTGPSFALQATDKFYVTQHTGDLNNPADSVYELSENQLSKGSWIDFVIKIKYSIQNNGKLNIWRRDQDECCFKEILNVENINTLFYQLEGTKRKSLDDEWHAGYYRSRQLTDKTGVTNILWLDGFTLAKTSEAAQLNAFNSIAELPGDYNNPDVQTALFENQSTKIFRNYNLNNQLVIVPDFYGNKFSVSLKNNSVMSSIIIFNSKGEIVMNKKVNNTKINIQKNEIGNIAGVYFIEVMADNKILKGKFIVY